MQSLSYVFLLPHQLGSDLGHSGRTTLIHNPLLGKMVRVTMSSSSMYGASASLLHAQEGYF